MSKDEGNVKWYLKPVGVILILFVVLGPLGLPLLYKSPKFSKTLKIILTVIVILYTSLIILTSLEIGIELYTRMQDLTSILD